MFSRVLQRLFGFERKLEKADRLRKLFRPRLEQLEGRLAPTATSTTVSTSNSAVIYGTPVTFTASITAGSGNTAPTQGSVDFFDTTTNIDIGNGSFGSSSGAVSTWTLMTAAKTFNVTAGDVITATYSPGSGFDQSSGTLTQTVTPAPITVTAFTNTKVYDGTTTATALPTITSGSLVTGDTAAFTETYDTKNVSMGKTLTPVGSLSDGNGGNNYAVTFVADTTGQITARAITVTATTYTKVYDGTTSTTTSPTITGSLAPGDTSGFTNSYNIKNVGTSLTMVARGNVNDGSSGKNYKVTFVNNTTGQITARSITVTASTSTKVYDGTTTTSNAPTITSGSLATGDTAAFTTTYNNKNVGTGKTLTTTGSVKDGNSGKNYVVTFVNNILTTGQITACAITVTASTNTKIYDGTTSAANNPTITSGSLGTGDTAAFTETYDTKNADTGKTLTASGSVKDGNGGNNYQVTLLATNATGQITVRAITVTASTNTKSYDGMGTASNSPTITSGSLVTGDTAAFIETYDTKNAGTGKTLTPSGSVNDGNGGNNYVVTTVSNTTGQITPAPLTITAQPNTKTYDGTTSAGTISSANATLTGLKNPVALAFDGSGNLYAANNQGGTVSKFLPNTTTPSATLTGLNNPFALAFDGSGNLYVANNGGNTVSKFLPNTTTPSATLTGLDDPYHLAFDGSGNLYVANLGNGTVSKFLPNTTTPSATLTGLDEPYALAFDTSGNLYVANGGNNTVSKFLPNTTTPSATLTGLNEPQALAFDAGSNLYVANGVNGTVSKFLPNSTTPSATLTGLDNPYALAFDGSGNLYVANLGNGTVSKFLPNTTTPSATLTGLIDPGALAFDASGNLYVANGGGTTVSKIATTSILGTDTVTATEVYNNANAGTGKTLSISAYTVNDGNGGNNYTVTTLNNTAGVITPLPITVTAAANVKVYDGTTTAAAVPAITSGTLLTGDTPTFTESYNTATVGSGKTLTPTGSVNDGNGGNNYAVSTVNNTNGVILPQGSVIASVTVSPDQASVVYGTAVTFTATVSAAGGQSVLSQGTVDFTDTTTNTDFGDGVYVGGSGSTSTWTFTTGIKAFNVTSADFIQATYSNSGNGFSPSFGTTVESVTARPITVTTTMNTKTYDGTTSAAQPPAVTSGTLVAGDTAVFKETYDTNLAGTGKTLTAAGSVNDGNGGHNYLVTFVASATGVINPSPLTITTTSGPLANNKVYDSTTTATLNTGNIALVGVITGDTVTLNSNGATGTFATANVGTAITVTMSGFSLSGSSASNYVLVQPTTTANITPAPLKITALPTTKTYDGTTSAGTISIANTTLTGLNEPDALAIDSSGNLYVENYGNSTVSKFLPNTTTPSATLTGLNDPLALALDASGNLYVANYGTTVSKFLPNTTTPSATLTGLSYPDALAFDSSGDLYVANQVNPNVSKFLPNATTPSATLAGVNQPDALAFDASGNLYVANESNGTVSKFLPNTTTPSATLTGLNQPDALAFDPSGNLYVANGGGTTVSKFLPNTTTPSATLTGLNGPRALAFDASGNLYVANYLGNTVSKFLPNTTTASATLTGLTPLNAPDALAFDGSGKLYVANYGGGTVSKIATTGILGTDTMTATEVYNNANAGSGKTVSISGYTINDGKGGNNYTVTTVNNTKGVIIPLPITVTAAANIKVYDGTTTAAAVPAVTSGPLPAGDTPSFTESYDTATAGSGKTLTPAGSVNDGNGGNNYTVTTVNNTNGVILPQGAVIATVTVSPDQASVVYGTAVTFTATVSAAGGQSVLSQGTVDFTDTTTNTDFGDGVFAGGSGSTATWTFTTGVRAFHVPSADFIEATYSNPGNGFSPSFGTTFETVTARPITVTAVTNTKTYDGTTSVSQLPAITSGTLVAGDTGAFTASYDTNSPATGKTLTAAGSVNDGNGGHNYLVTFVASATGVINPAPLTIISTSGPLANNKVYDSTTTATLNTGNIALVGVIPGDSVFLFSVAPTGTFATANVGTAITVATSGFFVEGPSASNYVLVQPTTTANIAPAPLTITALPTTKTYDGTTNAGTIFSASATLTGLNEASALAFDGSGNLYVANYYVPNYNEGTVSKFLPNTTTPSATLTGLGDPNALAFDASGNLYVANYDGGVNKFLPNSTTPSATLTGLNDPDALAVDSSGNVYVANFNGNTVSKFLPNTTTASATLTGLDSPDALAFDASGNLYVANYYGGVSKFLPNATTPSATLTGLASPDALAFDASGNLYVANFGGTTVSEFLPNTTTPSATLTGLTGPDALAFDASGNLYVVNKGGGTVSKFLPNTTTPSVTLTGFNDPDALAFDGSGKLYVANFGSGTVSKLAPTGLRGTDTLTATEVYNNANAGSGKIVSISGYTINDGNGGNNYTVTTVNNTTGLITTLPITATATTNTKTYDGTTTATALPAITSGSLATGDTPAFSETYDTSAVGTGKTLTPAGSVNDGNSGNNYAVTFVNNTSGAINVAIDHFALIPTTASATAGSPFALLIIAEDPNNNVVNYNGTISLTSSDPKVPNEGSVSVHGGYSAAPVTLDTASSTGWTITVAGDEASTPTMAIPVTPAATSQFVVSNTAGANYVTGTSFSVTVTAEDAFGNVTPSYAGTVHFTSTDPRISAGSDLPANYTFTTGSGNDNGVHTFTNGVTLLTPGSQTVNVTDTNTSTISGTSSAIQAVGLQVTSVVGNATGFTVNFNKAFDPATLKLYGTTLNNPGLLFATTNSQLESNPGTPQQLTGSVVPNANDTAFTFVETTFGDQNGGLPNGVYDVSLLSSAAGLKDMSGVPLDASNTTISAPNLYSTLLGQAATAYSKPFTLSTLSAITDTTQAAPTQVALSLPAFAQGPGLPVTVQVHDSGGAGGTYSGIPVTISDGNHTSTVSFSVTYNAALLTVTGGIVDPSVLGSYPNATFSRTATGTPVGGMETDAFTFSTGDGSLLAKGSAWTLGDVTASVPNAPGQQIYKDKQLLTVSNITSDGTVTNLVGGNGFEVVAYLGDTSGDGNIQLNDATQANNVGNPFIGGGFSAYQMADPVVVADTDGAGFVDSSSVGNIASLAIGHAQPTIPTPPQGRITSSGGADPDLSLPGQVNAADGLVEVPVNLDNAMPAGSTGLTEATLDLTFNPQVLSVGAADVHLGSLPSLGTGWTVSSVVNQAVGQLVIQLYSMTPLTVSAAGSLVTVDFHTLPGAQGARSVSLVDWANPTGQVWFRTSLSDTNGALTLGNSTGQVNILGLPEPPATMDKAFFVSSLVLTMISADPKDDQSTTTAHAIPSIEPAPEGEIQDVAPIPTPSNAQLVAAPVTLAPTGFIAPYGLPVFQLGNAPLIDIVPLMTLRQLLTAEIFSDFARQSSASDNMEGFSYSDWDARTADWLTALIEPATTAAALTSDHDIQRPVAVATLQAVDYFFAQMGNDFDLD